MTQLKDYIIRPVNRIRRNHALEHATLQILSARKRVSMAGNSDTSGFYLAGNVTTQDVQIAVDEALNRLKAGESQLAVHPYCGTNYFVSGTLAAAAAMLGMLGAGNGFRKRLDRFPLIALLVTATMILTTSLGLTVQARYTTLANPADLEVVSITTRMRGSMPVHRVKTRNGN